MTPTASAPPEPGQMHWQRIPGPNRLQPQLSGQHLLSRSTRPFLPSSAMSRSSRTGPHQAGIDQRNAPFCYPAELAHGFFHRLISLLPIRRSLFFCPTSRRCRPKTSGPQSQVCPLVQGETFYLQATFRQTDRGSQADRHPAAHPLHRSDPGAGEMPANPWWRQPARWASTGDGPEAAFARPWRPSRPVWPK